MTRQGARPSSDATVFTVASPSAEAVYLCLFEGDAPERRLEMRSGGDGIHSVEAPGVGPGTRYGYRTEGPRDRSRGLHHDPNRLLIDPWCRSIAGAFVDHPSVHDHDDAAGIDTAPYVPRSVVVADPAPPRPVPRVEWADTILYETHVRGLTMRHPDVAPELRGTYLGAASPAITEHLSALGVTTVELMPVAHHVSEPFLQRQGRTNYWGYSTLNWFAPHAGYATDDRGEQITEFVAMVDAFHAAGLEVILDVVFNHTAEGDAAGPILSMKGLDNEGWYRLDPSDRSRYLDWTGTGNTIATHTDMIRQTIIEALRWWHRTLGADGFRFDLAVTLGRGRTDFEADNLRWLIDAPGLEGCKLIAEPWDLGPNGYQVGNFGQGWVEWNGRYRDDVRDVWRGAGSRAALAVRMGGSPDLFGHRPASVNFVTAHDGFTLADLVAYDHKHNRANGEDNRDGHDDNRSWNSGVEGATDDGAVLEVRRRRAAGLLTTLLLSSGIPMLLGGDELGRSQGGNNNAYSIDDQATWYDWSGSPLAGVVAAAAALRAAHPLLTNRPRVEWLSLEGDPLDDLSSPGPMVGRLEGGELQLVIVLNPTGDAHRLRLPEGEWRLELDSSDIGTVGTWPRVSDLPAWTVRVFTTPAPTPT